MMESNRLVGQTIGTVICILLIILALFKMLEIEIAFVLFPVVWLSILLFAWIKNLFLLKELFKWSVYVLVASTFLNQSVLSINIGFFSLFLYRILLLFAFCFYLLYGIQERSLVREFQQIRLKGIWLFLCAWLIYGLLSILWAKSIIDSFKYMFLLAIGILFVYLVNVTFTRVSRLIHFYGMWIGMTVILLMIGLINHYFEIQLPSSSLYGGSAYKLAYPTAVFFNQNDFAAFLSISFFFYVAVAKNSSNTMIRLTALFLGILSFYVIYLTESRASILAVIVGIFAYLFLLLNQKAKKAIVIAAVAIGIAGTVLLADDLVEKVEGFIQESDTYVIGDPLPSNVARINLLRNTFYYVLDSYGMGVGAGNIPFYLENEAIFSTGNVYQVHNWLAEIIGNFGIFIFIGYIGMYLSLFIHLYNLYKKVHSSAYKMLLEACMLGQIAFLVSSISPSSVSNLYFHWVFLGFVIATVSVFKKMKLDKV